MPTDTTTEVETEEVETEATETEEQESPVEGEEALGDPGKKALDAMKAAKRDAEKRARDAEQELARLKAAAEGREVEHKAEREAIAKANARVLAAEMRAAAAGKLNDPGDALRYLDTAAFEVSDTGEVDTDAIAAAISDLIASKPYLAVQDGRRFQGTPDAGTRKETGPRQLTRADIAGMTPEQRAEAYDKGLFRDLLGDK